MSVTVAKAASERFIFDARGLKIVSAMLIILVVSMSAKKALNAAAFVRPAPALVRSYSVPQSIADSWEWMRVYTPPDATVITDSFVSSTYLTIFTSANPFIAQPINTLAPTASLEERFARAHKIFGVSQENMQAHLADPPWALPQGACLEPCAADADRFREREEMRAEFGIHGLLYGNAYSPGSTFDQILKGTTSVTPPEARKRLREYYEEYQPRQDEFSEHTYLYVGPWERILWGGHLRILPESKPVFANEEVQIYRIQ